MGKIIYDDKMHIQTLGLAAESLLLNFVKIVENVKRNQQSVSLAAVHPRLHAKQHAQASMTTVLRACVKTGGYRFLPPDAVLGGPNTAPF